MFLLTKFIYSILKKTKKLFLNDTISIWTSVLFRKPVTAKQSWEIQKGANVGKMPYLLFACALSGSSGGIDISMEKVKSLQDKGLRLPRKSFFFVGSVVAILASIEVRR